MADPKDRKPTAQELDNFTRGMELLCREGDGEAALARALGVTEEEAEAWHSAYEGKADAPPEPVHVRLDEILRDALPGGGPLPRLLENGKEEQAHWKLFGWILTWVTPDDAKYREEYQRKLSDLGFDVAKLAPRVHELGEIVAKAAEEGAARREAEEVMRMLRARAAKKKQTAGEWIFGRVELLGGDAIVWLARDGSPVGIHPAALMDVLSSVNETMRAPIFGEPRAPTRIRIADEGLARKLTEALDGVIPVVCSETPEVAEFAARFATIAARGGKLTLLEDGVSQAVMAAFFSQTAALARVEPSRIPDLARVISVAIPSLGFEDVAVSLVKKDGEALPRAYVYESYDDFRQFMALGALAKAGVEGLGTAPFLHLVYRRGADIPTDLRKEIAANGWEVASANAYPDLTRMSDDVAFERPIEDDYRLAGAALSALAELLETEPEAVRMAWRWGSAIDRTIDVPAEAGTITVRVRAPHPEAVHYVAHGPFDVRSEVRGADGKLEKDWYQAYAEEVLDAFYATPAAAPFGGAQARPDARGQASFEILMLGWYDADVTLAKMTAPIFERLLYERLPTREVLASADPQAILSELTAFFDFAAREWGLEGAAECVVVAQHGGALDRLAAAMRELSSRRSGGAKHP